MKRTLRRGLPALAVAAALCASSAARAAPPSYHVTDLGLTQITSLAISPAGDIVGIAPVGRLGVEEAARYRDGRWVPLGDGSGFPVAVNSKGVAVGYRTDSTTNNAYAVEWKGSHPAIPLTSPQVYAVPAGIDDAGTVAINVGETPALWRAGRLVDIPPPGAGDGVTIGAMNGDGDIAALVYQGGPAPIMRRTKAGWQTVGGLAGATSTYPSAMNDAGHIACGGNMPDGNSHACWYDGTALHDLHPAGLTSSWASGINATDEVVGGGLDENGDWRAYLWFGGQAYDLFSLLVDAPDWSGLFPAFGIDDSGRIIALGRFKDGLYHNCLLTPVQ